MKRFLFLFLLIPCLLFSQTSSIQTDYFYVNEAVTGIVDHVPQFGGTIYYVSKAGSDANSGISPDLPKLTIQAALDICITGDAVNVMAGTYAETVIMDGDVSAVELWCEIGVILDPDSGTPLTISGSYNRVICRGGALRITPGTNETGVLISGGFNYLAEIRVSCFETDEANSADIGFDITGNGNDLRRCRVSSPDVAAFKIQGDKVKLENCCTGGGVSGTVFSSIGYWFTNSCDKARLIDCGSQGNGTAGI